MTPRVQWTPTAEKDLEEIAYYIAVEDGRPSVADRLIDAIVRKCEQYSNQPVMGSLESDLGENLRSFSHKRYVVIYRPTDDGIEIMRVVDGSRDYPRLFRGQQS